MSAEPQIPLAKAIEALRRELAEAQREGEGQDLRFQVGPVELQLQLELSSEVGGEAGLAFWFVSIGGKGSRTSGTTHTVKLTLVPVTPEGDLVVRDAEIQRRPR